MKKIRLPFSKIKATIEEQLKKGTSPAKLSLAITLGFILGIVPFPGINTAICLLLAWRFKLNVVVIQAFNYAAFPLQIILFIPFIKIASKISTISVTIPLDKLWELISHNPASILGDVFFLLLQGVALWALVSIPLFFSSFYIAKRLISRRFIVSKNSGGTIELS